jgi:outer membrane biosynthesis protein TonB
VTAGTTVDGSLLQSRPFRRLLAASALAHLVLTLILTFGSWWRPLPSEELEVVYVTELPAAALPTPSPQPPAPARQQIKEIVIPDRPKPKPKPPAAKPPPVPARPEPKPIEAPPTPEPERKPNPSASALLDKLRDEAKTRQPQGVPEGQGTGERAGILDAEKAEYQRKVQAAIEPHWIKSACVRQQAAPRWIVELAPGGATSEVSLGRSSGDRYCDDSAERAILKAQIPAPPPGIRVLSINFEELR